MTTNSAAAFTLPNPANDSIDDRPVPNPMPGLLGGEDLSEEDSRHLFERLVLGRVARLVATGVAVGVGVSLLAAPAVRALLYELEPRDPFTLIGSASVLTAIGLLAGWLPARRAARIDPARVLREG